MYPKTLLLNTDRRQIVELSRSSIALALSTLLLPLGCHRVTKEPTSVIVVQKEVGQPKPMLTIVLTGARSTNEDYACGIFEDESDFKNRENPILTARMPASDELVAWRWFRLRTVRMQSVPITTKTRTERSTAMHSAFLRKSMGFPTTSMANLVHRDSLTPSSRWKERLCR